MNELQKFIKENKDYEDLLKKAPYFLKVKSEVGHLEGDKKISIFMYNAIKSDFNNPIVRLSRGCILTEDGEYLCRPFDKFFNKHESYADEIDYSKAWAEEKRDGSIIKLWHSPKKGWMFSTNGMIDAKCAIVNENGLSFFELIKMAHEFEILERAFRRTRIDEDVTFIFELTSRYNKIVVDYQEVNLTLLDVRENNTGKYIRVIPFEESPRSSVYSVMTRMPKPKSIPIEEMEEFPKSNMEGFVIKDIHGNMIKVKNKWYVEAHRMAGNKSSQSLIKIWYLNESSEFLSYFPELKDDYAKVDSFMKEKISSISNVINDMIATNRALKMCSMNRKEIAEYIRKRGLEKEAVMWKHIGKDNSISEPNEDMIREYLYKKFLHGISDIISKGEQR